MKRNAILAVALAAASLASGMRVEPAQASTLYEYAASRNMLAPGVDGPVAESVARKAFEIAGSSFPWISLKAAPEHERLFYTTFVGVLTVLEPFRDPGDDWGELPEDGNLLTAATADEIVANLVTAAGAQTTEDMVDMAKVGRSLMERVDLVTKDHRLKGWAMDKDPAEIVTGLLDMLAEEKATVGNLRQDIEEMKAAAADTGAPASDEVVSEELKGGAATKPAKKRR